MDFSNLMGTPIDYVILVVYFVGILAFGAYFARFSKSTKDFFFGGQRFSWWLIAASLVATGIGSYSFLKYAQTGFMSGMSSSMSYLNDWLIIPLFMFGWFPIIYFMRIKSVPEFFERRFDRKTRVMATIFVLLYLLGYIGLNFYLMGVALHSLLGINMWLGIIVVATISAIYVTTGGQTAVIFTDLIQGLFLYIAGAILLYLGISHVCGFGNWWQGMDLAHKLPFPGFNTPAEFSYSGMFWGEGMIGSLAFTFMNQGFIMRYLAVKSVYDGRKTITFNTLILMPISAVVVGSIGWIAVAMATRGEISTNVYAKDVFMLASNIIAKPGIFGFVIAALTAALMSTIDTLINATAAIGVFDIYKPYFKKNASDKHYLSASRVISIISTIIGLALVPIFAKSRSIMAAHYAFVAMITPPMLVAILFGILWKKFNANAAFFTMLIGGLIILSSVFFPQMTTPLSNTHGLTDGKDIDIVFERYDDGPIMGPRSAYNWGEVFDAEEGSKSNFDVEYWLSSDDASKAKAPVYMKQEEVGGRTVTRYCARINGLEARSGYKFRVIENGALRKYTGIVSPENNPDYKDDIAKIAGLVEAHKIPKNKVNIDKLAFTAVDSNSVLEFTIDAEGTPKTIALSEIDVPDMIDGTQYQIEFVTGMTGKVLPGGMFKDEENNTHYIFKIAGTKPGTEYKYIVAEKEKEIIYDAIGNYGVLRVDEANDITCKDDFDKNIIYDDVDYDKKPIDILGEKARMFTADVSSIKVKNLSFKTAGDYKYFRAMFGFIVCIILAIFFTLITKQTKNVDGLTIGSIFKAKEIFKGSKPNEVLGEIITVDYEVIDGEEELVYLNDMQMDKLNAKPGDLLYVTDARGWLGGLRSIHVKAGETRNTDGKIVLTKTTFENGNFLDNKKMKVEKII